MTFNSGKFECMRYWADPTQAPDYQYLGPDSKPIKVKTDLRDLGVQLSSDLSFSIHIENTVNAASRIAGWGLRTFYSRCRRVMLTILKSLVQPRLDYCSQLWSPSDQGSINKIESIQYNLVNRIRDAKLTNLNYWEKLKELQLFSQEHRSERYQVIFLWKIWQELVSGYNVHSGGNQERQTGGPKICSKTLFSSCQEGERKLLGRGLKYLTFFLRASGESGLNMQTMLRTTLTYTLSSIPDQPTITGLGKAAQSNILLHQIPTVLTSFDFLG